VAVQLSAAQQTLELKTLKIERVKLEELARASADSDANLASPQPQAQTRAAAARAAAAAASVAKIEAFAMEQLLEAQVECQEKISKLKAQLGGYASKDEELEARYEVAAQLTINRLQSVLEPNDFRCLAERAAGAGASWGESKSALLKAMLDCLAVIELKRDMANACRLTSEHERHWALAGGSTSSNGYLRQISGAQTVDEQSGYAKLSEAAKQLVIMLRSISKEPRLNHVVTRFREMACDDVTKETLLEFAHAVDSAGLSKIQLTPVYCSDALGSDTKSNKPSAQAHVRAAGSERGRPSERQSAGSGGGGGKGNGRARSNSRAPGAQSVNRRENRACHNCGQVGHLAETCPNEVLCYNCKETGHISKDCPEPPCERDRSKTPGRGRTRVRNGEGASSSASAVSFKSPIVTSVSEIPRLRKSAQSPAKPAAQPAAPPAKPVVEQPAQLPAEKSPAEKPAGPSSQSRAVLSVSLPPLVGAAACSSSSVGPPRALVDSGAQKNIMPPEMLSNVRGQEATLISFNGEKTSSDVQGEATVVLFDAYDANNQMTVVIEAWGANGLQDTILSAQRLSKSGASIHIENGNCYVDFKRLGGPKLRMRDDCLLEMEVISPDDDASESDGSSAFDDGSSDDGWYEVGKGGRVRAQQQARSQPSAAKLSKTPARGQGQPQQPRKPRYAPRQSAKNC
jgi:hypothetical protein